jgi:hypothetical protein
MSNLRHNYKLFSSFFGGIFLFLWIIYPYLQAEILTNLYISKFNVIELCQKNDQKTPIILKNAKLITYNPDRNGATLDCLYSDSNQNIRAQLAFRGGGWEVVFVILLNKDRNFYWPIYS